MKPRIIILLLALVIVASAVALPWLRVLFTTQIIRAESLDRATLNPDYMEDWHFTDFKDDKLGIAISIDSAKKTNMAWSSSSSAVNDNPFNESDVSTKWLKQVKETPDGTVTVFIKKSEATFTAVIEDRKMNLYLRYIALRDMDDLKFNADQKLEFLKFCAADPNATMRVMAMQKANDYKATERVVALCCRAMTDPCPEVTYRAIYPLVSFFHVKDSTGKNDFELGGFFSGSPENYARMLRDKVLHVAQAVHTTRPDLVTDHDLKVIAGPDN